MRWVPQAIGRRLAGDALSVRRVAKFGAAGLLGSLVYCLLLVLFIEGLRLPVMLATSIAFALVVLQQYLLHHAWVFRSGEAHARALPAYVLMTLVGFGINFLVMYTGVTFAGIHYLLVQIVAIGAVVTWNFVLSTLVIFRETKSQPGQI